MFSTEGMGFIYLMVLEFFAVAALHYYLLHRYTRRRSQLYTADEGFTFGQGYGFLLAVSGFAGIIVGVVQAVYLHLIVGYSAYIDRYVAWMTGLFAQMGSASSSVEGILSQAITELAEYSGAVDPEDALGRCVEQFALRRHLRPHHCGSDRTGPETVRYGGQRVIAQHG